MLGKLYAILATTFAEIVRQPIYGILVWSAVGLLLLNPTLASYSLESGHDVKIMKDVGLATLLLFGLLISVFSAVSVITREIESFTVLTVVSKPVPRPLFLVGKFLGVVAATGLAYYFLTIVFLLTLQQGVMETRSDKWDWPLLTFSVAAVAVSLATAVFCNYVYGWHFSTTLTAMIVPLASLALIGALLFDDAWKPQSIVTDLIGVPQDLSAIALMFSAVLVLAAFAVAISTRFGQVMTLLICSGVLLVGLLSDYYLGSRADESLMFGVLYHAVPNFQFFWASDALTEDIPIHPMHVARVGGYALFYTAAVLSVGIALFQTREVG